MGCAHFTCGGIGHHKDCVRYSGSMQEMIDGKNERIKKLERKGLFDDLLVMSNARQLIKDNKSTSNAVLYMGLFGTGLTSARDYCRKLNLDPDSNLTPFK
jgi:hypothetical protein